MPKFTIGWSYSGEYEVEAESPEAAREAFDEMDHGEYLAEIATTEPYLEIEDVYDEEGDVV